MALQFIGIFLLFTCTGASLSSGHLDFMSGAKKENLLHAKDPHVEVKDFSDSFKDIASSPDKMKTTFHILNRPNDSRFKLDLALIISKLLVLEDESQSLENKKNAWSVLYPVLAKYDANFTYPADYDVESGEYMEITINDWIDRYTQDQVAVRSARSDDNGSGHLEVLESGNNREVKSLLDGSWSFDEYLRSLEQESEVLPTQEGSGSVEEQPVNEEDGILAGFLSDRETTTEESAEETESEDEASVEEVELHRESREEGSSEGEESEESAASFDPIIEQEASSTEGYVLQTDGSVLTRGYELHFTTEDDEATSRGYGRSDDDEAVQSSTQYAVVSTSDDDDDDAQSTRQYRIVSTDDDGESSTQYQIVSTSEDGKELGVTGSMDKSTTEYYVPEMDINENDLLEILAESGAEDSGEMEVTRFVDGEDLLLQHRVGYAVEVHPEEFEKEPIQAGSIRGVPGVHFPDYEEIPITSFSCADKKYIPGFYADLETGCQVFHVCWPHRRESFLCPVGTLFNQAILSCDYWYSTNCSLSHYYDDVNDRIYQSTTPRPHTHKPCYRPEHTTPSHDTELPCHSTPSYQPEQSSHATPSYHPEHPTSSTPSYQPKQPSHATPSYKPKKPSHPTPSYTPEQSTPSYKPKNPSHTTPSYHPEQPSTPSPSLADVDWTRVISILPIKSKVYVYPPHQVMKPSKTSHKTKHHISKTVVDDKTVKAIASQIVSKVLHAAEMVSKIATQPIVSHVAHTPKKLRPITKINPKFVVRGKSDDLKAILAAKGVTRKVKKTKLMTKQQIPEVVLGAMELAGTVLQKDILPLTRLALVEGSLKHSKSKKH